MSFLYYPFSRKLYDNSHLIFVSIAMLSSLPIPVKWSSKIIGQYKIVPHKPMDDKNIAVWQNETSPTTRLNATCFIKSIYVNLSFSSLVSWWKPTRKDVIIYLTAIPYTQRMRQLLQPLTQHHQEWFDLYHPYKPIGPHQYY